MKEPPYEFSQVKKCKRNLEGSVVVRCPSRRSWHDQLSELLLLCNEAADRAHKSGKTKDAPHADGKPLSLEYIADRLDIDDPLWGYLVRSDDRGWLQGYITVTTFTTFHAWFHWDSVALQAGLELEQDDRFCETLDGISGSMKEQANQRPSPLRGKGRSAPSASYRQLSSSERGKSLIGRVVWAPPTESVQGWEVVRVIGYREDGFKFDTPQYVSEKNNLLSQTASMGRHQYKVSVLRTTARQLDPRHIEGWDDCDLSTCLCAVTPVEEKKDSKEEAKAKTKEKKVKQDKEAVPSARRTPRNSKPSKTLTPVVLPKRKSRRAAAAAAAAALKVVTSAAKSDSNVSSLPSSSTCLNGSTETKKKERKRSARAQAEADAEAAAIKEEEHLKNWSRLRRVDGSGSLSRELEAQLRDGDPDKEGVVWPHIAEISLLGALGCGKALLSLVLEELCAADSPYEYAVLQATEASVPFYESMGFVRVGAIVRHSERDEKDLEDLEMEASSSEKKVIYKDDLSDHVMTEESASMSDDDVEWNSKLSKKKKRKKRDAKAKRKKSKQRSAKKAKKTVEGPTTGDSSPPKNKRPSRSAAVKANEVLRKTMNSDTSESSDDSEDSDSDVIIPQSLETIVKKPKRKQDFKEKDDTQMTEEEKILAGKAAASWQEGIGIFIAKSDDTPRSIAAELTAKYAAEYAEKRRRLLILQKKANNEESSTETSSKQSSSAMDIDSNLSETSKNIGNAKASNAQRRSQKNNHGQSKKRKRKKGSGGGKKKKRKKNHATVVSLPEETYSVKLELPSVIPKDKEYQELWDAVSVPPIKVKHKDILFLNKSIPGLEASSKLHGGTVLRVPVAKKVLSGRHVWERAQLAIQAKDDETPLEIATAHGIPVERLLLANRHIAGLRAKSNLMEGTRIKLPPGYDQSEKNQNSTDDKIENSRCRTSSLEIMEGVSDVIAYRHWTFRNEAYDASPPSYMMALKLQKRTRGTPLPTDGITAIARSRIVNFADGPVILPPAASVGDAKLPQRRKCLDEHQSLSPSAGNEVHEIDMKDSRSGRGKRQRSLSANSLTMASESDASKEIVSSTQVKHKPRSFRVPDFPEEPLAIRVRLRSSEFKTGAVPAHALFCFDKSPFPEFLRELRPAWPRVKSFNPDLEADEKAEKQRLIDSEILARKMPKRSLSAYTYFMSANRSKVIERNPGIKQTEVMSLVAAEWKAIGDDPSRSAERTEYIAMAERDRARFLKEKAVWDASRASALKREEERDRNRKRLEREAAKAPPKLFSRVVQVRPHRAMLLANPGLAALSLEEQIQRVGYAPYYFVLTYIPDLRWARLAPMRICGRFETEERGLKDLVGRPRWMLEPENSDMVELDVSGSRCVIARSRAVRRVPDADKEEWDVMDYVEKPGEVEEQCAKENLSDKSDVLSSAENILPLDGKMMDQKNQKEMKHQKLVKSKQLM